ncbi:MAG: hypothetical protein U0871_22890 [Gemmataceae bacterium]
MSRKHHGGPSPVPAGNRPQAGPGFADPAAAPPEPAPDTGVGDQEQDPKRRLGGFEGKGEHSRQQPGMLNDGDHHSR